MPRYVRRSTEATTGHNFNSCLVNYYASRTDSIAFHSNDERFLGQELVISSFSLGARQDFLMKQKPAPAQTDNTAKQRQQAQGR